tara:strand:+ start:25 stop:615 length:591 start_codon:yes stop_codon:yes gene_type:complete
LGVCEKNLILITITLINFSVSANDINNFEIGPISLGQSLLDYADKDQIKSLKKKRQYKNDKYIRYEITKVVTIENYDFVDVMTKKNDENYIIEGISAAIRYNKLNRCLEIKKEIQKNIESILEADEIQETEFPSVQDSTGESIIYGVQYYTKPAPSNESIIVNCYHMTEKSNVGRVLRVSVNTHEFSRFIIKDAHN